MRFLFNLTWVFDGRVWGHARDVDFPDEDQTRIFSAIFGPMQTVQRAEFWRVILTMQALYLVHLSMDNKNVFNAVCRLLPGTISTDLCLVKDGDLQIITQKMLRCRYCESPLRALVGCANPKEHYRPEVRVNNDLYPRIVSLNKLMVAISREVLNHYNHGGTSVHPMVWDHGSQAKTRRGTRVITEVASQRGPPGFLDSTWHTINSGTCVVGPLVLAYCFFFASFLSFLRWPVESYGMSCFGVSYLEVLFLCEVWAGHRLLNEKTFPAHKRSRKTLGLPSAVVSEGVQIRLGCGCIGSLFP